MDWLTELRQAHPALTVHVVVASGADPKEQRRGLVTQAIAEDHACMAGWRAYLGGSAPMVEAAMVVARSKGLDLAHVHPEAFYMQGD